MRFMPALRFSAMSFAAASFFTTTGALADKSAQPTEPKVVAEGLEYPEGVFLPRNLTDAERDELRVNPLATPRAVTPPPIGPVRAVAEYEPMDAIIMSWYGASSWNDILARMAAHITTTGDADVIVYVSGSSAATAARNAMVGYGAINSRIITRIRSLNAIWVRDYGPRYVYEGDVRAVIDHTYNRNRPLDNALNVFHAAQQGHALYELPLIHGGGNYHLNALNDGRATNLIVNENPTLTPSQIWEIWNDYQAIDTTFHTPFPTNIDATQHIDMWMQIIGDNKIVISDFPLAPGSFHDNICDSAATTFASNGWTVFRTPAYNSGGVHYTYTNMVLCNDLVLLPTYTHSTAVNNGYNTSSLATIQAAMPGKTVVQIPCQAIVSAAGVMHCIVMHMPEHLGGANPTAYLRTPNGGANYTPGQNVEISWLTDDSAGVSNVDIRLSVDGGATFPTVIASAIADTGTFNWAVPQVTTQQARIRVVARNGAALTGHDDSDENFLIMGSCLGDTNGDSVVDFADLSGLLGNYGAVGYGIAGDVNGDGVVDFADFSHLLANYGDDCN